MAGGKNKDGLCSLGLKTTCFQHFYSFERRWMHREVYQTLTCRMFISTNGRGAPLALGLLFFIYLNPINSFHAKFHSTFKRSHTYSIKSLLDSPTGLDDEIMSSLTSASAFIDRLNTLKLDGRVSKWNSTLMDIRSATTKADLQFISRNSFSSANYFEDIIAGARRSQQQGSIEMPFIAVSATSFLLSALVIPLMPIPDWAKNVFGLFFLLTPFLLIITNLSAPGLYQSFQKKQSEANTEGLSERILYHEAGHFLAGYLCGVPVISYDVTGDRDAGTTIALDISESSTMTENVRAIRDKSGNLLVVSMAGMVAETLRFGDSKGGAEDLLFATEVLRLLKVPNEDKEGSLRWAVLKALLLLKINRDALDRVADTMRRTLPVAACIRSIEEDAL